jgi:chromosome segregation ATPase
LTIHSSESRGGAEAVVARNVWCGKLEALLATLLLYDQEVTLHCSGVSICCASSSPSGQVKMRREQERSREDFEAEMRASPSGESGMEGLWNTFSKQKQLLMNSQNEIQSLQNHMKRIENKSQNVLNENQKISESNEQFEETIEINHEMRQNLEKDLQELYASKSNMMLTLQAIDSKIHQDQKKATEEKARLESMINTLLEKSDNQTENQKRDKGKNFYFATLSCHYSRAL